MATASDQHLKNILAIVIAFASAVMFIVVLVRLRNRAAAKESAKAARYSLDPAGRRIAGGSGFVAAALAVFWLLQRLRGDMPGWSLSNVDSLIIYSSLGALSFGVVGIRRDFPRVAVIATLVFTMASVSGAVGVALKAYLRGASDLGRKGLVTVVVILALTVANGLVGKRLRPEADRGNQLPSNRDD